VNKELLSELNASIYFTTSGLNGNPNTDTPLYFQATSDATFRGSDLNINTNVLSIISNYTRFATEDTARYSQDIWNLSGDVNFDVGTFTFGDSEVEVDVGGGLDFVAAGDFYSYSYYQVGSETLLDTSFTFIDRAHNDIQWNAREQLLWEAETSATFNALENLEFNADSDLRFIGRSSFTASSEDHFASKTQFDAHYLSPYRGSTQTFTAGLNLQFYGGYYHLQVLDSAFFNADRFIIQSAPYIELTANSEFNINTGEFIAVADRHLIINGEQSWTTSNFTIVGNAFMGSPPNQDLTYRTENDDIHIQGNHFSANSDVIQIQTTIMNQNAGGNYVQQTETEGTILWESGTILLQAAGEFHIQQNFPDFLDNRQLNIDNQFHFLAQGQIEISTDAGTGGGIAINAEQQFSGYASDIQLTSTGELDITAQTVDVLAETGPLTLTAGTTFTTNSVHFLSFYSQRGAININDIASLQNYKSSGNAFVYAKDSWNLHQTTTQNLNVNGGKTISILGGDINSHSTGIMNFDSVNDITMHGFDGITVSSLSTFDLNADHELDLTGPTVKLRATDDITVEGDDLNASATQGNQVSFVTTDTDAFLEIDSAANLYLWSNDEFKAQLASFDIKTTGTSPTDPQAIFIKSSFQDGGIISYAGGQFFINTIAGSSRYLAADYTPTGGDIQFTSQFTSFSATGVATAGITLDASGSQYDESLNRFVGILHRSLNGNILIQSSGRDGVFTSDEKLEIFSTAEQVIHQAVGTDIVLTSTIGGMTAQSANDFLAETQSGDMLWDLSGYSLWKAADTISTLSDCDARAVSSTGNVHVLADRGEVSFLYRGDQLMHFASATWNTQGADQFSWGVNGNILGDGSFVNLYADTDIRILSDASSAANQGIEITAARNSLYRSSNNNGIAFTASQGTVDLTATTGWVQQVATDDLVWRGEGDNVFTGGLTLTVQTLGSIRGQFSESVTMNAQSDFVAQARNTIGYEAVTSITVGTQGNSIITVNTGGDTLDNGAFIDAGTFSLDTGVDIDITSNRFISESDGDTSITVGQLHIESQGTDSIGKDLIFDSALNIQADSQASITLNAASQRYLYDNVLGFSGVSTKLDSATFIDGEAAGYLQLEQTGAWTLTSPQVTFTSYGDSSWSAGGNSVFTTTAGQINTYSDKNTVFKADTTTGIVNFQTNFGNSPITFETQDATADFVVEASNSFSAGTVSKISITGDDGIVSYAKTTTSFSAADEFTADSVGDIRLLAEGQGQSVLFTGTDPSGSGSRISFASAGNMEGQFDTITMAARDQYFSPDVDLTFDSYLVPDSKGVLTITATNDLDGTVGGSFEFRTGLTTFKAGQTINYNVFGADAEDQFGISWQTLSGSITGNVNAGSLFLTPDTGLYVAGNNNVFSATKYATYNTINDQVYTTTEDPTDITFSINRGKLFLSATNIDLSATGDEPTSGVITITALGYNVNTNYPSGTESFAVAFIGDNDVNFNVEDSRFVMDNMQFGTIVPTPDGSVLFEASGFDEYGRAIEIISGNILVTSELNVVLRAVNVNFLELPHDPYAGSTINESGHYFDNDIDFHITRHRPTILSVDDQVYTSLGRNINGNGIELTSTVPGGDIQFVVETLNINSDASASFLANSLVKMVSVFDTQIVSLKSVNINAHGVSSNPEDWVDAIHVRTGARDPAFQIGANIAFTPKRDLYMTSFDELTALIVDSLDIAGPGIEFNNVATDGYNLNAGAGVYQAFEFHYTAGDNFRMVSETQIRAVALNDVIIGEDTPFGSNEHGYRDGRTDIYVSFDQDSGMFPSNGASDLIFDAGQVRFDAPLVDFTSTTSLVFPIRTATTTCAGTPGQFWLQEIFANPPNAIIPSICYCSTNAPLDVPVCYRLFVT